MRRNPAPTSSASAQPAALALEHRAARVTLVTGLSTGLSIAFQLVSVPVCLHYWGQARYGQWLALLAAFQLVRSLDSGYIAYVGNRLNLLYHRDIPALRQHLASALAGVVVLGTLQLSLAAGAFYSAPLAQWLGMASIADGGLPSRQGLALLLVSWVLTGSYIGIVHRLLIPAGLMYQAAWWAMAFQVANFAAIMLAAMGQLDLWQTSVLFALSQAVIYLLSAVYVGVKLPRFFPWWRGARWRLGLADLVRSTWLTASNLVQQGFTNGLVLLIAALAGPAALPVFTTVRTLANLWTNITTVLTTPLLPEVVRFHAHGETAKLAATQQVHWLLTGTVVNLGVLLSYPLLPELYRYWTARAVALDNSLLCLLLASVVAANFSALMSMHLNGINSLRIGLAAAVVRAVLGLGVGAWLFPALGLVAFGVGVLAGELAAGALTAGFFHRYALARQGISAGPALMSAGSVLLFLANAGFNWVSAPWLLPAALMGVALASLWGWNRLSQPLRQRLGGLLFRR